MSLKNVVVSSWQDVQFTDEELGEFKETFKKFDADNNGHITTDELSQVFKDLGESVPGYKLRDMIAEVDTNNNKTVEWDEFITMMKKVRVGGSQLVGEFANTATKVQTLKRNAGKSDRSAAGTTHTYAEEECVAFADWINSALLGDEDVKSKLPIDTSKPHALFPVFNDGILMCKLINQSVPDTIDPRAINKTKLNAFLISENQTLAVNSAAAIGCNTVNIGAEDLVACTEHLVLGLLWQIIRIGLFSKINIQACPGLTRLLEGDEELADLLALPPDVLLLRWVNFHLREGGSSRQIHNFSGDIADSEAYTYLLKQISPAEHHNDLGPLSEQDPRRRAEMVLANADKLGCRKFVTANEIVKGNAKLNLAFVANLFNEYPGLTPEEEMNLDDFELDKINETREERTFRNWMNSLGVRPFVNNLYSDLDDGMILLQLFDKIQPGIVKWEKVNKPPFKKMGANVKKVENLNYAIELAKELKFSVVGIQGKDIFDGIKQLTLAVVWQLMRAYTLSVLEKLSTTGERIADAQIIDFVNEKLASAQKTHTINGFKDQSISTSLPVIDLIDAIKPGSISYSIVTEGQTDEDKTSNAKYAISMARKIGAGVYALPEDLVEVMPKMVLTVFACLMARALK